MLFEFLIADFTTKTKLVGVSVLPKLSSTLAPFLKFWRSVHQFFSLILFLVQ